MGVSRDAFSWWGTRKKETSMETEESWEDNIKTDLQEVYWKA